MSARGGIAASLTATALVIVLASSIVDLRRANDEMVKGIAGQKTAIEGATRMEVQLDGLARGLQALAASGNRNAQDIIGILAKSGVDINPSK